MLTLSVKVQDTPAHCRNLVLENVSRGKVTLVWEPPLLDGGADITNYIVEKRDSSKRSYSAVTNKCTDTTYIIEDLSEKTSYFFRVSAENENGIGDPCETRDPVKATETPGPVKEVTNLTEDIEYEFRVMAVNDAGIGAPSNISIPIKAAEPKDIPCAPSVVCVSDSTNNSISLEWTKPVDDGGMEILGYIIEMMKGEEAEWKRVNEEAVAETHYKVTGLQTGAEYKFRVAAVNHIGRGEDQETAEHAQAIDRLTPPQVDIDATFKQTHIVKAGGSVCLGIHFRGDPIPTCTWVKEEGELSVMSEITTTDGYTSLTIENCSRNDIGKYTVNLENASGSKSLTFVVKVMDTPGPPQAVAFKEVSRDNSVSLGWLKPEHDGGSRIQCYIIEARQKGTDKWVVVGSTKNLMYVVEKLNKGEEYDFRVKAKNEAGHSQPKKTVAPVLVKEPHIEPAADLSDMANQLITCNSGKTFTIDVPISGRPTPKVTWKLEEMRLKSSDRVTIKLTKDRTSISVREAMRGDGGKYYLTLENAAGTRTFPKELVAPVTIQEQRGKNSVCCFLKTCHFC
uniref:Titin n=1 Tax=Oryzias melastigma TaxID=30732 RepID=A0A3B3C380_ORYME